MNAPHHITDSELEALWDATATRDDRVLAFGRAVALAASRAAAASEDSMRLDWLEAHPSREIGADHEEQERVVYSVTGYPNDREWHEIGRGPTLRAAIDAAIALAA